MRTMYEDVLFHIFIVQVDGENRDSVDLVDVQWWWFEKMFLAIAMIVVISNWPCWAEKLDDSLHSVQRLWADVSEGVVGLVVWSSAGYYGDDVDNGVDDYIEPGPVRNRWGWWWATRRTCRQWCRRGRPGWRWSEAPAPSPPPRSPWSSSSSSWLSP